MHEKPISEGLRPGSGADIFQMGASSITPDYFVNVSRYLLVTLGIFITDSALRYLAANGKSPQHQHQHQHVSSAFNCGMKSVVNEQSCLTAAV
jgi:hypothetical protein